MSNFITNKFRKFVVAKVRGNFLIFEALEVTFLNVSTFWPIFNLNDVIRRFCGVTTLTSAFFDSVLKNKHMHKI